MELEGNWHTVSNSITLQLTMQLISNTGQLCLDIPNILLNKYVVTSCFSHLRISLSHVHSP